MSNGKPNRLPNFEDSYRAEPRQNSGLEYWDVPVDVAPIVTLCSATRVMPRGPRLDALPLFVRTLRSRSSPGIFDRRPPRHAAPNPEAPSRQEVSLTRCQIDQLARSLADVPRRLRDVRRASLDCLPGGPGQPRGSGWWKAAHRKAGKTAGSPTTLRARPRIRIAFDPIVLPLQRLEVAEVVAASSCHRFDVINLPPVCGIGVAVLGELHWFSAQIVAPDRSVVSRNLTSYPPHRVNRGAGERVPIDIGISVSSHCDPIHWL